MSKIDELIAAVHWCINRSVDPMITHKLQEAINSMAIPVPALVTRGKHMTVSDLVQAAGPSHYNARIKLQIVGGNQVAYSYINNRLASILRSEDVVIETPLTEHSLRRKTGARK